MTSYWHFTGIHPSVNNLPGPFKTAILNSQEGTNTLANDAVIGSVAMGSGFCSSDVYKHQLYCACVNAPVAGPECIFAPCTNQSMLHTDAEKACNNINKLYPGHRDGWLRQYRIQCFSEHELWRGHRDVPYHGLLPAFHFFSYFDPCHLSHPPPKVFCTAPAGQKKPPTTSTGDAGLSVINGLSVIKHTTIPFLVDQKICL